MKVYAVFDIGKTNKKFFLFDRNFQQVYKDYIRFDPITDDDGDPCEDLNAIEAWMHHTLEKVLSDPAFNLQYLNFSSYGASFVHIGEDGQPVSPLYDYLKPLPQGLEQAFHKNHGTTTDVFRETASPALGFLNSGLQIFWLKNYKPDLYNKVKYSLHLPQYLSYRITGKPVSEFTSIGCHTLLWDFDKNDYHQWVYREMITSKFPETVPTNTCYSVKLMGKKIKVGVGIHDSSSALIPYIRADQKPFLLVSTGTWSIALNGFSEDPLSAEDLEHDCLNYMRINGNPVRSCRLFLGNEYRLQVNNLHQHYQKEYGYHRDVIFDPDLYQSLKTGPQCCFRFKSISIQREQPGSTTLDGLESFEEALHQLMLELVELQVACINRAIGTTNIKKIYIDGGFADNSLYVQMIADSFPDFKLRTTKSPLGSALGAAIISAQPELNKKFLKKKYAMKKLNHGR